MGARKLPPERVFGQPRLGHRLRAAPSATWRRISTSAAVSNTPTTWLIASSCRSASSLRRYSSITFSACTRTFLSGAYSEDEALNARNGVDHRRRRPIIALTGGRPRPGGSSCVVLRMHVELAAQVRDHLLGIRLPAQPHRAFPQFGRGLHVRSHGKSSFLQADKIKPGLKSPEKRGKPTLTTV